MSLVGPQSVPASSPAQMYDSSALLGAASAPYPMPAAIPGIDLQSLMASAQGPLDAHRVFVVSSVRNDEIASRGPNPFASDCSRPWAGNPGLGPYLVPPTVQQPSTRPMPDPPVRSPIVPQASSRPQGVGFLHAAKMSTVLGAAPRRPWQPRAKELSERQFLPDDLV